MRYFFKIRVHTLQTILKGFFMYLRYPRTVHIWTLIFWYFLKLHISPHEKKKKKLTIMFIYALAHEEGKGGKKTLQYSTNHSPRIFIQLLHLRKTRHSKFQFKAKPRFQNLIHGLITIYQNMGKTLIARSRLWVWWHYVKICGQSVKKSCFFDFSYTFTSGLMWGDVEGFGDFLCH